jgi:hypothetical protein
MHTGMANHAHRPYSEIIQGMIPKIDQFYHEPKLGVVQFKGYQQGLLIFDRWDRWGDQDWTPQNRLHFTHIKKETKLRPILPPQ